MKIKNFLAFVLIVQFAVAIYLLFEIPLLGVLSFILNFILVYVFDKYDLHFGVKKR